MSQSLDRGLIILKALAEESLSLSQISDLLDVHKSTALRLLRVLEQNKIVKHDVDRKYRLSSGLFSLATQSVDALEVVPISKPHLRSLSDETGLTVHLAEFNGHDVTYLAKHESRESVRMYSRIGIAAPLHATAVSKAILAQLPDEEIDAMLRNYKLKKFTEKTITRKPDLIKEIVKVRSSGYSVDNREHEDFVHCIGVGVKAEPYGAIYGISLTATTFTTPLKELIKFVPNLQRCAKAITSQLA